MVVFSKNQSSHMYFTHCNTYHFTDTDECLSSPCAHTCTNTVGSFVCSCDVGYVLNSNQHSCDGTYINLFTLIFAMIITIKHINKYVLVHRYMHMHMYLQISMNVYHLHVVKYVLTLLVAISAHVIMGMNWTVME